ncbi:DUF4330 domain-containing protein [Synechococcus sp. CC9311]|uniref:DUF4330 domain-containing protein n=1 Tax=Synechococcus sp. (strain CC9311) TaxID=64471 RepID=UPI0000DDAE42|nr:DUF4330 domain-containing protein [Synechococcus sp. CC9311]ABI47006.1 conserved hypothetical protein [Synechococcus sp. CC9311]
MALRDRLRGVSVLDVTAGLIGLMAVGGVLWSPKLSNTFAKANGSVKTVQIMVDVRRVSAADPDALVQEALSSGRASIIIRNQPSGSVKLIRVDDINRVLAAVQPDGSVVTAPDPNRATVGTLNARFVLQGDATVSKSGVVLAGTKLKVGTPVELEGALYRLNGTVSGVKVQ